MGRRKRVVLGKLGLDSHDNGLRIIAKWLMDSGYEVIYAGLYNTVDRIVAMAMEEDADGIGVSFLGGEHLYYGEALVDELHQRGMGHVKVIIGGVIAPQDVDALKEMGVDEVFTPGTMRGEILRRMDQLFSPPLPGSRAQTRGAPSGERRA